MINSQDIEKNLKECFPYPPYNIQLDFARELYQALDSKKLCFFESPTGTVN